MPLPDKILLKATDFKGSLPLDVAFRTFLTKTSSVIDCYAVVRPCHELGTGDLFDDGRLVVCAIKSDLFSGIGGTFYMILKDLKACKGLGRDYELTALKSLLPDTTKAAIKDLKTAVKRTPGDTFLFECLEEFYE